MRTPRLLAVAALVCRFVYYAQASERFCPDDEHLSMLQGKAEHVKAKNKDCMAPGKLLFLHTMKNGGTSVDRFLACKAERSIAGFRLSLGPVHLYEGDKRCTQPSICSTHGEWRNRVELCGKAFEKPMKVFTVMREPVARVWSMYNYQKAIAAETNGDELPPIDKMIFNCRHGIHGMAYNEWMCANIMNHVTIQTLAQSDNLPYNVTYNKSYIEQAKEVMSKLDAIMLMDDFETFADAFDKSNIFNDRQETTAFKEDCVLEHANAIECNVCTEKPTAHERKMIEESNQMDIQLYKHAKDMKTRFIK